MTDASGRYVRWRRALSLAASGLLVTVVACRTGTLGGAAAAGSAGDPYAVRPSPQHLAAAAVLDSIRQRADGPQVQLQLTQGTIAGGVISSQVAASVTTMEDAYVAVMAFGIDGSMRVVYPKRRGESGFTPAGKVARIAEFFPPPQLTGRRAVPTLFALNVWGPRQRPRLADRFVLSGPMGVGGELFAIASRSPLPIEELRALEMEPGDEAFESASDDSTRIVRVLAVSLGSGRSVGLDASAFFATPRAGYNAFLGPQLSGSPPSARDAQRGRLSRGSFPAPDYSRTAQ